MTPRQLNYFLRIAELSSFTKAAAVLRIAQPALSRQIQQLEEDLGLRLLVRSESGVSLTEAGVALQSKATGLLQHFAKVRDEVGALSESVQGRMHFGMPPSLSDLVTIPLLIGLHQKYPAVRPSLIEGISSAVYELILAGRLDFGIVLSTESMLGLHSQKLFREQLFIASKPAWSCVTGSTMSLAEVAGQPLILTQPPNAMRTVLEKAMAQQDLSMDILLETNSSRTQTELVARGVGSTVLPFSALAKDLAEGRLAACPIDNLYVEWTLVHARERALSLAGQRTIAMLQEIASTAYAQGNWLSLKLF